MSLKIYMVGGEYNALDDTIAYPSDSAQLRSRMEIHMAENEMSLDSFVKLMSNEEKTKTIRVVKRNNDNIVEYDNTYTYYIVPREIGKKMVDVVDHETGAARSEHHLVAVLEQLTYTEQKLYEMGIK